MHKKSIKYSSTILMATISILILPELAMAAGSFDLNKAAKGGFDPLIAFARDHWPKAALLCSLAAAYIGEGDMRQRAIRAGMGAGIAGGFSLAVFELFGV